MYNFSSTLPSHLIGNSIQSTQNLLRVPWSWTCTLSITIQSINEELFAIKIDLYWFKSYLWIVLWYNSIPFDIHIKLPSKYFDLWLSAKRLRTMPRNMINIIIARSIDVRRPALGFVSSKVHPEMQLSIPRSNWNQRLRHYHLNATWPIVYLLNLRPELSVSSQWNCNDIINHRIHN